MRRSSRCQAARSRMSRAVAGVLLLWTLGSQAQGAELIDRVLAVAAGDLILLSDVRLALALGLVSAEGLPDPLRTTLSTLIDRSLMLDEVRRYAPPAPTSSEIDRAVGDLRARFDSSQAFDRALRDVGVDEGQLRETLTENLRIRAYLTQRFSGDTPERRQAAIDEWLSGLRRRINVVDLYEPSRR